MCESMEYTQNNAQVGVYVCPLCWSCRKDPVTLLVFEEVGILIRIVGRAFRNDLNDLNDLK